jgi:ADP-ribose pyrophosphatase YjhB (NUDIX family)
MAQEIRVARKPRWGDYKVKWTGELSDPLLVVEAIEFHLPEWTAAGAPSVWVKLQGRDLDHVPFFLSHGFTMHRVGRPGVLILNRWLKTTVFNLQPGPFAYVGCAALCLSDSGRVLAVRDAAAWRLPGGLLDPARDQNPGDAAARHCFEATGVYAEFLFIAAQSFTPNSARLQSPELCCVCRLRPLLTDLHGQNCGWIDVGEFLDGLSAHDRGLLEPAISAKTGATGKLTAKGTVYGYE